LFWDWFPLDMSRKEHRISQGSREIPLIKSHIGPTWTNQELLAFFNGYKANGIAWKKIVENLLPNRTVEMAENLYSMHKNYLSGKDASAKGLQDIMKDYYNNLISFPVMQVQRSPGKGERCSVRISNRYSVLSKQKTNEPVSRKRRFPTEEREMPRIHNRKNLKRNLFPGSRHDVTSFL